MRTKQKVKKMGKNQDLKKLIKIKFDIILHNIVQQK